MPRPKGFPPQSSDWSLPTFPSSSASGQSLVSSAELAQKDMQRSSKDPASVWTVLSMGKPAPNLTTNGSTLVYCRETIQALTASTSNTSKFEAPAPILARKNRGFLYKIVFLPQP